MRVRGRVREARRRGAHALTIAVLAAIAFPGSSTASDAAWLSLGVLGGSTQPPAGMADYQWDIRPQAAWGAQALAGAGPWAGGLRLWSTATTQDVGLAEPAAVHRTSLEVVGRRRLASWWGVDVAAMAGVGMQRLSWDPDRVTVSTPGGPIDVDLTPVHEWIGGGGLALRRPLGAGWAAGLEVDHRFFALDAAHREGASVVESRESFGEWSARLELAWLNGL